MGGKSKSGLAFTETLIRCELLVQEHGWYADNAYSETSSQLRRPLCSPERETGTLKIGFSDMMCDVGNAAIKDAIANIARNRKVLHFLSCIARFLGHFSGLATIRPSGLLDSTELTVTNPAKLPHKKISGREVHFTRASQPPLRRHP